MADEQASTGADLPDTVEALAWAGAKLDELNGSAIGRVEGVLVDAETGDPRWLLVRMGRFGHHTALPFSHAVAGVGRVWAPYDRDMVRRAPRIDAGKPLTREKELELCSFFGIAESFGRGSELSDRAEGAVTAEPARPNA